MKMKLVEYNVVVLVLMMLASGSMECIEKERKALTVFKQSLTDPYNRLSSWIGQDCCNWNGVTCNNVTAHVVELDLIFSGLIGSEVSPSLAELKHLEYLDLGGNNFSNSKIPSFIGDFKSLRYLSLESSSFEGVIPHSLGNLSALHTLLISDYGLKIDNFNWLSRLSTLQALALVSVDVSQVLDPSLIFNLFPSLSWLALTDLNLIFPLSSVSSNNLTNIETLVLRDNSISGFIPSSLFMNMSSLGELDLSSNKLNGTIPESMGQLSNLEILNLRSNKLNGTIPESMGQLSNLKILNLDNNSLNDFASEFHFQNLSSLFDFRVSYNNISGSIPSSICGLKSLSFITLANNHLSGIIPHNCWNESYTSLRILDLSSNNLTGVVLSSISNLSGLNSLHLYKNNFSGELPVEMKTWGSLKILDLGNNGFSGKIPSWIKRLDLQVLNLRSNMFDGSIVHDLCAISDLQILNLAQNNFTGTIPSCFGNFRGMTLVAPYFNVTAVDYEDSLNQIMKGVDNEYTSTLHFLVSLDLSSNDLEGHIPEELMFLSRLNNFNLSYNRLTGVIPTKIGSLTKLESLDLAHNHLTARIPQSISELTFLSALNLSYNNLSGVIPTGNQLQTLQDPSIYEGNPGLCGIQIHKTCAKDESVHFNDAVGEANVESEKFWFYMGAITGVVVGFWGVCGVLFFKKTWRYTYFRFVQNVYDMMDVKFLVCASLRKKKSDRPI